MTYQEKIIMFMERKTKHLIEKVGQEIGERYSNDNDKQSISLWDNKTAKKIWGVIKEVAELGEEGLTAEFCPFCIKYNYFDCIDCDYGKRHGVCADSKSDFSQRYEKYGDFREKFPNSFYKELIKEIESKDISKNNNLN